MKSLRCLLGRHRWTTEYTEDRKSFRICRRCRGEDWSTSSRPDVTGMDRTDKITYLGGGLGPG
ncbi:hypothetical protein BJ968_000027 [Kineococcus aurantiacus]|uniref:Uncharacterized protein n=1 Tax=Kineococcus aurantiacus TaxID=37633 RepID=A0A7Y9DJ96_9ACTN|nr:hypothetical protein [Kineococcus aurantiacus]